MTVAEFGSKVRYETLASASVLAVFGRSVRTTELLRKKTSFASIHFGWAFT
jgi:hypothetical protein